MSKFDNIYHCTIHKAASSFFWRMLENKNIKQCFTDAGFDTIHYETKLKGKLEEKYTEQKKIRFVPNKFFVHNWYSDYQTFKNAGKSNNYHGIYIYRDPRELIVSAYFSWKNSHSGGHKYKKILNKLSFEDGVNHIIHEMHFNLGMFDAMVDWVENCNDDKIKIFKYEDFFKDKKSQKLHLLDMFEWFDMAPPKNEDLANFDFQSLSGGRSRGDEDIRHHFRSGISDSYKTHLNEKLLNTFYSIVGEDYVERLGYDKNM